MDALKEALKGTDADAIKAKMDDLQKDFYELSSKMYQQQGQQAQGGPDTGANAGSQQSSGSAGGDGYVDADFKEVDDNK